PTSTDRMSLMAVEADRGRGWIADRLLIDFGFYEPCQVSQRLLPAEITGLRWNGVRQALLHHVELGADRYFFQRHSHLGVPRQVGIVEFVRVAQAFVRNELDIFASERMAFARRDILNVPPTFGSRECKVQVKPLGGSHFASAPLRGTRDRLSQAWLPKRGA